MKAIITALAIVFAVSLGLARGAEEKPLNVLVVTGGHDFDQKAFPRLFEGHEGMKFTIVKLKDDSEVFEDISRWDYDVLVLYNMTQRISPARQANFKALLDRGVGLVALHHSIANWSDFDAYAKAIGGKYFLKETEWEGRKWPTCTYKHDVDIPVAVAAEHPITRGIKGFVLHDETYKGQWVDPEATLLLTTDEATSDRAIAWCKTLKNSRTCYIQLGHGPQAFSDANYRRLMAQAVRWTAQKP